MYENILSEDDYVNTARNYFRQKDVKVLSHQLKPISETKKGFAGEHLRFELTCEVAGTKNDVVLFLKTKPQTGGGQVDIINKLNLYGKEIFFYDVLLAGVEKLGCDTSFAPKCYYSVQGSSLVLENITLKGFTLAPVFTFYDIAHCKAGLRSLALFHAAGFVFEETKSKELGRTFRLGLEYAQIGREDFYEHGNPESFGMQWIEAARKLYSNLIDFLPETEEYKEEFRKKLAEKEFGVPFRTEYNIRKTIGHGDLWSNNMMFKLENDIPVACCLLDYQVVRYYFPCFDVLLYLYSNTTREFRRKHMADLIDHYFQSLSEEVKKHDLDIEDIHPRKDFDATLGFARFEPMLHGFSCQSTWCFDLQHFTELLNSGNDLNDFWFGDRTPLIVKNMKANEWFKKMMMDCLYEIHDFLFNE